MSFSFKNKRVLITGGSGTWGKEFARQLMMAGETAEVTVYSRGEYHQVEMRRAFQRWSGLRYVIGDVRDAERLRLSTRKVDAIIHLAALKHVPVVEENPREALNTNTIGSQNVIDVAQENEVERVLFVSSDKAVDPMNFYGISKLAAERLMIAGNQNGSPTRFIVYRAGNVMGSAGSVIPIFHQDLILRNKISLTDPAMTRFFFSCEEAVRLAIESLTRGVGGETFVPRMRSARLSLLGEVMVKHLGNESTVTEIIGTRPGEKFAELLISRNEAARTKDLDKLWVVLPFFPGAALQEKYGAAPGVSFGEFSSDTADRFTFENLENLLGHEGFLSRESSPGENQLYFKKGKWEFH